MAGDLTARSDGGFDYFDNRQRPWVIYPPGKSPMKEVPVIVNGLPTTEKKMVAMWPPSSTWRAGLRVFAYGRPAFEHLVSGDDQATVVKQVEWFADDAAKGGAPWLLILVIGYLAYKES